MKHCSQNTLQPFCDPFTCAVGAGITVALGAKPGLQTTLERYSHINSFQKRDMDAPNCLFRTHVQILVIYEVAAILRRGTCQAPSPRHCHGGHYPAIDSLQVNKHERLVAKKQFVILTCTLPTLEGQESNEQNPSYVGSECSIRPRISECVHIMDAIR